MPKVVLGLVTLFHPEIFLSDVHLLPHRRLSRSEKTRTMQQFAKDGRVTLKQNYRDVPVIDSGKERRRLRGKKLRGEVLVPILAEPRIINVWDEPSPKAKWKIEFRKNWPEDIGRLPEAKKTELFERMSRSTTTIKGLWINPTLELEKWDNPEWANLVVVALRRPEPGAEAPVRFYLEQERAWIEWEDES